MLGFVRDDIIFLHWNRLSSHNRQFFFLLLAIRHIHGQLQVTSRPPGIFTASSQGTQWWDMLSLAAQEATASLLCLNMGQDPCFMSLCTCAMGPIKATFSLPHPSPLSFLSQRLLLFHHTSSLPRENCCMVWFCWDLPPSSITYPYLSLFFKSFIPKVTTEMACLCFITSRTQLENCVWVHVKA